MTVRAEFFEPDAPDEVLGAAEWTGAGIEVDAQGSARETIARIFRRIPVIVDDPAIRSAGTSGPTVLPPGTLVWFNAAARVRAEEEGLRVRFVPKTANAMGWDPAGAYRPFAQAVERMAGMGEARSSPAETTEG
jgi:hypothetical protein